MPNNLSKWLEPDLGAEEIEGERVRFSNDLAGQFCKVLREGSREHLLQALGETGLELKTIRRIENGLRVISLEEFESLIEISQIVHQLVIEYSVIEKEVKEEVDTPEVEKYGLKRVVNFPEIAEKLNKIAKKYFVNTFFLSERFCSSSFLFMFGKCLPRDEALKKGLELIEVLDSNLAQEDENGELDKYKFCRVPKGKIGEYLDFLCSEFSITNKDLALELDRAEAWIEDLRSEVEIICFHDLKQLSQLYELFFLKEEKRRLLRLASDPMVIEHFANEVTLDFEIFKQNVEILRSDYGISNEQISEVIGRGLSWIDEILDRARKISIDEYMLFGDFEELFKKSDYYKPCSFSVEDIQKLIKKISAKLKKSGIDYQKFSKKMDKQENWIERLRSGENVYFSIQDQEKMTDLLDELGYRNPFQRFLNDLNKEEKRIQQIIKNLNLVTSIKSNLITKGETDNLSMEKEKSGNKAEIVAGEDLVSNLSEEKEEENLNEIFIIKFYKIERVFHFVKLAIKDDFMGYGFAHNFGKKTIKYIARRMKKKMQWVKQLIEKEILKITVGDYNKLMVIGENAKNKVPKKYFNDRFSEISKEGIGEDELLIIDEVLRGQICYLRREYQLLGPDISLMLAKDRNWTGNILSRNMKKISSEDFEDLMVNIPKKLEAEKSELSSQELVDLFLKVKVESGFSESKILDIIGSKEFYRIKKNQRKEEVYFTKNTVAVLIEIREKFGR